MPEQGYSQDYSRKPTKIWINTAAIIIAAMFQIKDHQIEETFYLKYLQYKDWYFNL